jgi:hypothetical protein
VLKTLKSISKFKKRTAVPGHAMNWNQHDRMRHCRLSWLTWHVERQCKQSSDAAREEERALIQASLAGKWREFKNKRHDWRAK